MPFLPKVPHIVGDDDELNEGENQSEMSNGSSDNEGTDSSSSYDDDSDDEESNEEEEEEEEEEDWSNNISYIVRTPDHVPDSTRFPLREPELQKSTPLSSDEAEQQETTSMAAEDIELHETTPQATTEPNSQESSPLPTGQTEILPTPVVEIEIDLTQHDQDENNDDEKDENICTPDGQAHDDAMDCEEQGNSDVEVLSSDPGSSSSSTKTVSPLIEPSSSLINVESVSSPAVDENFVPSAENADDTTEMDIETAAQLPQDAVETALANNVTPIEPLEEPRRLSLRSAYRANPKKSLTPLPKSVRNRQRPMKTKIKAEKLSPPPISIGARVAKRPRHAIVTRNNSTPKSSEELANPLEVTEYFTQISATLVRHRVNLLPFLCIRKQIDRLVGDAIAKTKST